MNHMVFRHESISEVGKVRAANEDSVGYEKTQNGDVFVVCDGMGGHVGGAIASNLAVKSIIEFFKLELYDNLILAIDKAFQFANEQIFAHTLNDPSLKGMGSTAAILIIKNEECYIGHVGDSRIYLKTEGQLHRITKDHSFVQSLVDNGTITDDEAENHPRKNQILKALGHEMEIKGTVCRSPLRVKSGDVFMLCSDGLNGMINDKMIDRLINFNDLKTSVHQLYGAAMDNRGADNISVILVGIDQGSAVQKSVFESMNPIPTKLGTDDLDRTNTSFTRPIPVQKKKSLLPYAAIGAFFILILAVSLIYNQEIFSLISGDEKVSLNPESPKTEEKYEKAQFEKKTFEELKDLARLKVKVIGVSDGEEIRIQNSNYKLLISADERLTGIEKVENPPVQTETGQKPVIKPTDPPQKKPSNQDNLNKKDFITIKLSRNRAYDKNQIKSLIVDSLNKYNCPLEVDWERKYGDYAASHISGAAKPQNFKDEIKKLSISKENPIRQLVIPKCQK